MLRALGRLPSVGTTAYFSVGVTLALEGAAALTLGLLTSALVSNPAQATLALPMLCFPAVLFSGAILPVNVMAGVGAAISTVIPVRWAFEAIGHTLGVRDLLLHGGSPLGPPLVRAYGNAGEQARASTGSTSPRSPSSSSAARGSRSSAAAGAIEMCRVVGYIGRPIALSSILYATDSSLVRQAYSPRMMATFLNLAGFGMAAWDPDSVSPDEPFTYKVTTLPVFDRNLRDLADKIAPTCLLAHVRGVTYSGDEVISQQNLHPFGYHDTKVTLAHNGHLREFWRMKYDLIAHVRPDLARRVEGTTDSEWIYVLLLSQLRDPFGFPGAEELAEATTKTLRDYRRRPRAQRHRHLVARQPVRQHRALAGRDALQLRLRLVPGRRPTARNRPAVREPVVHARQRVPRARR